MHKVSQSEAMTINNIGEVEFLQEYTEFPYALLAPYNS
jgi:hypothetical protein